MLVTPELTLVFVRVDAHKHAEYQFPVISQGTGTPTNRFFYFLTNYFSNLEATHKYLCVLKSKILYCFSKVDFLKT